MNHPLLMNIRELGYDELERKHQDIMRRMNQLRSMGQGHSEMWDQLALIMESLETEKSERMLIQNRPPQQDEDSIWINTDPLPDDADQNRKQKPTQKPSLIM
jgi:hypothetical protein